MKIRRLWLFLAPLVALTVGSEQNVLTDNGRFACFSHFDRSHRRDSYEKSIEFIFRIWNRRLSNWDWIILEIERRHEFENVLFGTAIDLRSTDYPRVNYTKLRTICIPFVRSINETASAFFFWYCVWFKVAFEKTFLSWFVFFLVEIVKS